ncbi:unnamed protein product, partial [Brassica oleracea var. botrytis]
VYELASGKINHTKINLPVRALFPFCPSPFTFVRRLRFTGVRQRFTGVHQRFTGVPQRGSKLQRSASERVLPSLECVSASLECVREGQSFTGVRLLVTGVLWSMSNP